MTDESRKLLRELRKQKRFTEGNIGKHRIIKRYRKWWENWIIFKYILKKKKLNFI